MRKVLVCGMLLGLLTSVSYAQRGHAVGGVGPSAATMPNIGSMSPNARINPNATGMGHDGVLPNATTAGKNPARVAPNATTDPTAKTVGPAANTVGTHAITVPGRVITPEAPTGPGPDR
jgi:hypothetical protein